LPPASVRVELPQNADVDRLKSDKDEFDYLPKINAWNLLNVSFRNPVPEKV
jgi:hypothetical protein